MVIIDPTLDIMGKLDLFIAGIPVERLVQQIVEITKDDREETCFFLTSFINETRVALDLIKPYLDRRLTYLEVGSGLCFFSVFLRNEGYAITGLEPVAGGFDRFTLAKQIVLEHYHFLDLSILSKKAQDLRPEVDGYFDVVFSNNVIEHIPELNLTLKVLANILSPSGKMVHGCPNYVVPYEPHLQIPVLKRWPGLSERIYRKKINEVTNLWASLNFISYSDVRRFARANNMLLELRKELTYLAFLRLEADPYFNSRQAGSILMTIYKGLKVTGLLSLLKLWPASLSTPMIFELKFATVSK